MYFVTLALTKFGIYTSTMHMTRYIHTVADIHKYTHTHTDLCILNVGSQLPSESVSPDAEFLHAALGV